MSGGRGGELRKEEGREEGGKEREERRKGGSEGEREEGRLLYHTLMAASMSSL